MHWIMMYGASRTHCEIPRLGSLRSKPWAHFPRPKLRLGADKAGVSSLDGSRLWSWSSSWDLLFYTDFQIIWHFYVLNTKTFCSPSKIPSHFQEHPARNIQVPVSMDITNAPHSGYVLTMLMVGSHAWNLVRMTQNVLLSPLDHWTLDSVTCIIRQA